MDGSALRNVFGSSASLAELSGDATSSEPTPTGYSRFGLNEHPPVHQMHTKVRRLSTASKGEKSGPRAFGHKSYNWLVKLVVLTVFGIVQTLLMHVHVPFAVVPSSRQQIELLIVGCVLVIFAGCAVPALETANSESAVSSANSISTSTANNNASSDKRNWKTDLLRSYGGLLGLLYLTEKLPRDGVLAWVIIIPSLWYISDTTINGFIVASFVALIGSTATFYQFPGLFRIGSSDTMFAAAGTAAAYFGTSLVAGNVGRGLHKR